MSEKVYGICGTNKCKREVIAKDNIIVMKEIIPQVSASMAAKKISFPDGITMQNSALISLTFTNVNNAEDVNLPSQLGETLISADISNKGIEIKLKMPVEADKYYATIVLLKFSE